MKRLPPAKRNQLIGVIIATVGLICAVYFLLISPQQTKNAKLAQDIRDKTRQAEQYKAASKQMETSTNELEAATEKLNRAEDDVASGDLYAWAVEMTRTFKLGHRVDIPTVGQPDSGDCNLIANFPYKQMSFSLNGTAYYHDLGKFVADFENKYPHCRIINLSADPADDSPGAGEKLNFKMVIVALVKPNS